MKAATKSKVLLVVIPIVVLVGIILLQIKGSEKPLDNQKPSLPSKEINKVKNVPTPTPQQQSENKPAQPNEQPTTSANDNDYMLTDDFEAFITELLIADEKERIKIASEILGAIRDNFSKIETIQGKVVVTINDNPPIVNGDFYINRRDRDDGQVIPLPWQYTVKFEDKQKGLNLFTADPQRIRPRVWFDDDTGKSNTQLHQLPPMLELQLPNVLLAPITAACDAYSDENYEFRKENFFKNSVLNIRKSKPEDEQKLEGGPFWLVETIRQDTFWLSEKGEFRSLVRKGKGQNVLDISYDRYESIGGVKYPTEITIHLAVNGPQGEQLIKAFTGEADNEAKLKFTLENIKINEPIAESKFPVE
jgi:hypothetical protein